MCVCMCSIQWETNHSYRYLAKEMASHCERNTSRFLVVRLWMVVGFMLVDFMVKRSLLMSEFDNVRLI